MGPKALIAGLSQAGSYLDGGASHPTQVAAIPLLEPKRVQQDKIALQKCFKAKRDHVLKRLADIGLQVSCMDFLLSTPKVYFPHFRA